MADPPMGRVLQRRALLVSPGGAISAALQGGGKALRIVARGRHRAGAQIGQLRPRLPRIGLVLARQIAEAHDGSLTLENRDDASGCIARLRLPRRSTSALTRPQREKR